MKQLSDFTEVEYLRAVGMGPETDDTHWYLKCESCGYPASHGCHCEPRDKQFKFVYIGPTLGVSITDQARKWELLCNVLAVLGPELDRLSWTFDLRQQQLDSNVIIWGGGKEGEAIHDMPHLALLTAFLAATEATKGESDE